MYWQSSTGNSLRMQSGRRYDGGVMNIVFWSPVHGQTRQSSNMIALALTIALKNGYRGLITQTQYAMNDMEDVIVGRTNRKDAREQFYEDVGIDALIRIFKSRLLTRTSVENCSVQLITGEEHGSLALLPGTQTESRQVFDEDMDKALLAVLREVQRCYDIVFIDVNPGMGAQTKKLIERADLVVVNLSQNISLSDKLFREFPKELEGKEVFYLIGSYISDSRYSIKNMRRRYKKMTSANSAVVPVNVGYMDAIASGTVKDYFVRNCSEEYNENNRVFMKEVADAANKVLRILKLEREKEA